MKTPSEEKTVIDKSLPTGGEHKKSDPFDVEELRQRAATKRKEQEELETKKNLLNSSKDADKTKAKINEFANKKISAPKNKKLLDSDDDELKRKANKGKKLPKQRGKNRGNQIKVDEFINQENSSTFVSMGNKKRF